MSALHLDAETRSILPRTLVLWCPQWPAEAARRARSLPADVALAVVDRGVVVSSSPTAQAEAVSVGLKVRQAQNRCPDLTLVPHSPGTDERWFAPVVRATRQTSPDVEVVQPGTLALHVAAAARYHGGEESAVELLLDALADAALDDVRIGVADGLFCAQQVAFSTTAQRPVVLLPGERTDRFRAGLPVSSVAEAVEAPGLADALQRMGIRTLGAFAAISREKIHARFGESGRRAHRLACGEETPHLRTRTDPEQFRVTVPCESHLAQHLVSECEPAAAELARRLTAASLVCHEIRVVLTTEVGTQHERLWRHAWPFSTHDMLERIRWQLEDLSSEVGEQTWPDHVVRVELGACSPSPAGSHATGLWGDRPDQRIVETVESLQRDLGHHGVRSGSVVGGLLLHERSATRPWGEAAPRAEKEVRPWPGRLPGPVPATVFRTARPATVLDERGSAVSVDARGNLSAPLHRWAPEGDSPRGITAWNGPWPIRRHWWQDDAVRADRFQVVDDSGQAWLLLATGSSWWIEAWYD